MPPKVGAADDLFHAGTVSPDLHDFNHFVV
jgi:hypothetical protein